MDKQHPHFGASYKIVTLPDQRFGIQVSIPEAAMVQVTGFVTEAMATAWIANHEAEIAAGTMARPKLHLWKKRT